MEPPGLAQMLRRIVLVGSLVLSAAACSGDDGGGTTTPAAAAAGDASTTTAVSAGNPNPDRPDPADGETLADYLGTIDFSADPEAAEAEARRVAADIQERIRRCMAEEGFEYLPVLPPEDALASGDEQELVEIRGFGITTLFGSDPAPEPVDEWEDPNREYIDTMTESERTAFFGALYGSTGDRPEATEVDPETGEEVTFTGEGGCSGLAYAQAAGDQQDRSEIRQQLGPALQAMDERIEADPRMVALDEEWSACMAQAGHDYPTRSAMYEQVFTDLQTRFEEIVGSGGGPGDTPAGTTGDGIDQQALEALQAEEVGIAVSDFECAEGDEDLRREVAREYEADFIAENREALDELRGPPGDG